MDELKVIRDASAGGSAGGNTTTTDAAVIAIQRSTPMSCRRVTGGRPSATQRVDFPAAIAGNPLARPAG
jgi:hypothetical protein